MVKWYSEFLKLFLVVHSWKSLGNPDIQEIIFKDKLAAVLMLGLSAAFDTIDHDRLLFKLENGFNISEKVLQWLRSFLVNRTSSVVLNGVHSPKIPVVYGVAQGSILGPLLFYTYMS